MAAIAWPYKLSQSPSMSKIDCNYEQTSLVQKFCTSSISYHLCKCEEINSRVRKEKAMVSSLSTRTQALKSSSFSSYVTIKHTADFSGSITFQYPYQCQFSHSTSLHATLNRPRGFGQSTKKTKKTKKSKSEDDDDDDDDDDDSDGDGDGGKEEDEDEDEEEEGVIPEIVTNRMISRMGFSVGIPLFIGLLFFPFFYYLKVVQKIDVPSWVPFIVSFIFFGTALLGVSYGIVSSSWDPLREGSLLGWNEAQKNWPVFWQSLWGGSRKK